jgi:SAM-dependent methyltransferase
VVRDRTTREDRGMPHPDEPTDATIDRVRRHFDEAVDAEWGRLSDTVEGRVSFEVHRRFLAQFVSPGMRVLEIGAGPGRFTRELAARGAQIEVTDLSDNQLAANRRRAEQEGYAAAVTGWRTLDVRRVAELGTASFDLVLAYGGPLSYVFEDAPTALSGMLDVAGSHGTVVASVMSTLGAYRAFLPAVLELPDADNAHILATGDLRRTQPEGHVCRMFRGRQVAALVEQAGGTVIAASASHWTSLDHPDVVARLEGDTDRWAFYLDREVELCAEPGALDGGTHILFAARRSAPA